MKRKLTLFSFLLIFSLFGFSQISLGQNLDNKQKGGIIFKIPEDVFPMDWKKNGFNGILMLRKDSPSGIFVCYPNEGEKIEDLKERAVNFIAPMFVRDEKEEKKKLDFQKSLIPNHKGDAGDSAAYYSYINEEKMVQILLYDRIANGNSLIYGYFAMKGKDDKTELLKGIWANEKGEGVKFFDKFWKTLKD